MYWTHTYLLRQKQSACSLFCFSLWIARGKVWRTGWEPVEGFRNFKHSKQNIRETGTANPDACMQSDRPAETRQKADSGKQLWRQTKRNHSHVVWFQAGLYQRCWLVSDWSLSYTSRSISLYTLLIWLASWEMYDWKCVTHVTGPSLNGSWRECLGSDVMMNSMSVVRRSSG